MYTALALAAAPRVTHAQTAIPADSIPKINPQAILGGSAAQLGEQQMNKGLVQNALEAISGKVGGVNVGSSGSDRVAMLNSVRVRGTTSLTGGNDPLVIIDGVYSDLATLSTVYPADIESVAIMKNASETAQFGSRGASGVIDVKTKRGKGGKFNISYDANMAAEVRYKYLDMLDAAGYTATARQWGLTHRDDGYDTNFQREMTRTGQVQNHHIAFSGGTEKANYRGSLALQDHQTIVRQKNRNNFAAKLDISQLAFDDQLQIDFGIFGSSAKDNGIFDTQLLAYSAAAMNPTLPYNMVNGGWQRNSSATQITPPAALLHERSDTKDLTFNTHLQLTWTPLKDLTVTAIGGYAYTSAENAKSTPTWVWAQGLAYRGETKTEEMLSHLDANWHHQWDIHRLNVTVGTEYQRNKVNAFWTQVKGFTSPQLYYYNLGAASMVPTGYTGSSYQDPSLTSFMATTSYTLMDRYTVDASVRADGSSMLSSDNRWGWFPSISLSWDAKKEAFLRDVEPISMMKFRMGYGLTGNLGAITSYITMNSYEPTGLVYVNGTPTITMGRKKNSNPDVKWEKRSTFNIGADIGLFQNRLLLTAEYYYSKTTDMLYEYDMPVPNYAFDKLLANIGEMSNSGFEIGLGFTPISKRDMELNVNVNMSWQKNKLISLSGNYNGHHMSASDITAIGRLYGAGMHGGDADILYQIVGQSLGVFYLPHCKVIIDNGNGHKKYDIADLNNDGVIDLSTNSEDRHIAGQATPKMTLGSNISFRYLNYDITVQMNGAFGHKIYNGTYLSYTNMSSFPIYNVLADAPAKDIVDQNVTDYWLEKGDYLNIDYVTLGWNVPLKSQKVISALRLSLSVNNLATITGYSGLTPMVNSYVVNSTLGIDDKRCYPLYRTFSLGVNLQF